MFGLFVCLFDCLVCVCVCVSVCLFSMFWLFINYWCIMDIIYIILYCLKIRHKETYPYFLYSSLWFLEIVSVFPGQQQPSTTTNIFGNTPSPTDQNINVCKFLKFHILIFFCFPLSSQGTSFTPFFFSISHLFLRGLLIYSSNHGLFWESMFFCRIRHVPFSRALIYCFPLSLVTWANIFTKIYYVYNIIYAQTQDLLFLVSPKSK